MPPVVAAQMQQKRQQQRSADRNYDRHIPDPPVPSPRKAESFPGGRSILRCVLVPEAPVNWDFP